jgi:uncharacterized protein
MIPAPPGAGKKSIVLSIWEFEGKGRGVVAGRSYRRGEVIDESPVLVIPADQWPLIEQTVLGDHCFRWGPNDEDAALVLGLCQLCNHSYQPNARYTRSLERRTIRFEALRAIEPGEEITVNYNGRPDDGEAVWFEVAT